MMQDLVWSNVGILGSTIPWISNHGGGQAVEAYGPTNPSGWLRFCDTREQVFGGNISFYDGHAAWTPQGQLVDVGRRKGNAPTQRTWSVLP